MKWYRIPGQKSDEVATTLAAASIAETVAGQTN